VIKPDSSNGNLSDFVAKHLIDHIRTNQLKTGATMPSEIQISADLGVSRGIVREAFRALRMTGILDVSNGRSPRVGRINDESIAQFLQHALSTEQATIEQVLDLRAAIEIRAAELAAIHRTARHVTAILKEVANMRVSQESQTKFIEADTRFHEAIAQATGNPLFALVGGALRESLTASIRAGLRNRTTKRQLDQIVTTHEQIAEAICEQNPVEARKFMTVHFQEALESFTPAAPKLTGATRQGSANAITLSPPSRS
jgi:GntR family transcriptional repressor for pyruvate dehydrogenase complex